MTIYLPNGLGDYPTSDSLGMASPLQVSGNVWYVDSVSGTDAVSPAGLNAARPLATLAQAITNAADHDIILLADAHTEALTSAVTVSKRVTIIGAASAAGIPTAKLYRTGGASVNLLTLTVDGIQLRNIRFPATATSAVATARINCASTRMRMVGCYVECGEFDTGQALNFAIGSDYPEIRNCTFINVSATDQPESAIKSSAGLNGFRMFSTTVDGGAEGFSNFYAVDLSAAAVTRAEIEGLSLLNGADMKLHASSTGWVHVELATGGSRVDW